MSAVEVEVEGDSGSLRAPQAQARAKMTAVEAVPKDEIGLLVEKWQGMVEGRTRKVLADRIIRLLKPTFDRVVGRFSEKVRGSLSPEDLRQISAIEAFKLLTLFDAEKANEGFVVDGR